MTSVILEDLELINLYSKNSERGFFYDYQVIIGGLLAFGAGYFVWFSTKMKIDSQKEKEEQTKNKYRIYYAKNCTDYVVQANALHDWLDDDQPSINSRYATQKLNENFLLKDSHIRFFSKKEVEILSLIEVGIKHSNIRIEQMLEFQNGNPDLGYSTVFNSDIDGKFFKALSTKAEELAKSIDEEKYLKWRSN